MCARWAGSFVAFLEDVERLGPRPPKGTLDRKDNDGDYEPENVRWATPKQQSRNQRRNVTADVAGRVMCAADIAREFNLPKTTVLQRIRAGKTGAAVVAPVKSGDAPCACGCGKVAPGQRATATKVCATRLWRRDHGRSDRKPKMVPGALNARV